MTYAKRVDRTHSSILRALRQVGCVVADTSRLGGGFPDAVIARAGRIELIEVKDGDKPPSARKLTKDEARVVKAFAEAGVIVRVVGSIDEALAL